MSEHKHCWHQYGGPVYRVMEDGDIVQICCECRAKRIIHAAPPETP